MTRNKAKTKQKNNNSDVHCLVSRINQAIEFNQILLSNLTPFADAIRRCCTELCVCSSHSIAESESHTRNWVTPNRCLHFKRNLCSLNAAHWFYYLPRTTMTISHEMNSLWWARASLRDSRQIRNVWTRIDSVDCSDQWDNACVDAQLHVECA